MVIKNQNSFNHVNFLKAEQFRLIGEYGTQKLLLVGRTKAYAEPIVAISETEKPNQEDLSACDLYELMKFGSYPVNLTAEIY